MIRSTLPLLLCLGGCAASGDYPSLSPRAIEQRAPFAEPAAAPAAIVVDPALAARLAAIAATIDRGVRDFAAALADARRAVDAAGPAGGEAWVRAQQALTVLDAARQPVTGALADLDALRLDAARGAGATDTSALDAAYDRAAAIAAEQDAAYRGLADRLPDA